jgi:hypothetical protein
MEPGRRARFAALGNREFYSKGAVREKRKNYCHGICIATSFAITAPKINGSSPSQIDIAMPVGLRGGAST